MTYGLQIFRDDGSLWMSPDVTPINYIGNLRYSGVGALVTSVPSSKALMVFIRNDAAAAGTRITLNNSGTTWVINIIQTESSGLIYLFSNMVTSTSGWGVAVYNSAGEMTWNTDMLPLQIFTVANPYGINQTGSYSIETGVQLAIAPGICSTWLAPVNQGGGRYLWGEIHVGASGSVIYGVRSNGIEVTDTGVPRWKYKENFVCIDITKYP
ncbi:hypothetical protein NLZ15_17240 [Atlantibacter subterranea]|uniref:hypothetical protein n=1 Tax=Atlantibacter subterraneus TaxID=255519 RepID=UPI0020C3ABE4|nr:hypothetical protein [Atlantibacter subterranea]UTJ46570.1 hypothetical protein NLZ15_17240 [Atlantibacter subterranea]